MLRRLFLLSLAAALVAGGCSQGDEVASDETTSTASTATTTTTAPTTAAPTATVGEQPESDPGQSPAGEPLDLVVLADSGGWGVAALYAAKAAEALDREIRAHGCTQGGARVERILSNVQQRCADDVADAEIIVFYVSPQGFEPPSYLTCLAARQAGSGGTWEPPAVTSVEDWQGYRDALDEVYDEIWKLRAGQPTILRAYGAWAPWLPQWRAAGIDSACMANDEVIDQVRRESAETHGASYVSMLDVFNGPEHDQDPGEKGWIAEDGMHLSNSGVAVLVDAVAAVGFELSEPPS